MCALSEETLRVLPLARTQIEPISWMVGNSSFIGFVRVVGQPELAHPILQGADYGGLAGVLHSRPAGNKSRPSTGDQRLPGHCVKVHTGS